MAKVMKATQAYWAGNVHVPEGTLLAEGDPRLVPLYVEEFAAPEPPEAPAAEPKKATKKT